MKALTRTRAIGGSLVVTLPSQIVKENSLMENQVVEIWITKLKKNGFGLLKGIGRFSKGDELDTEL